MYISNLIFFLMLAFVSDLCQSLPHCKEVKGSEIGRPIEACLCGTEECPEDEFCLYVEATDKLECINKNTPVGPCHKVEIFDKQDYPRVFLGPCYCEDFINETYTETKKECVKPKFCAETGVPGKFVCKKTSCYNLSYQKNISCSCDTDKFCPIGSYCQKMRLAEFDLYDRCVYDREEVKSCSDEKWNDKGFTSDPVCRCNSFNRDTGKYQEGDLCVHPKVCLKSQIIHEEETVDDYNCGYPDCKNIDYEVLDNKCKCNGKRCENAYKCRLMEKGVEKCIDRLGIGNVAIEPYIPNLRKTPKTYPDYEGLLSLYPCVSEANKYNRYVTPCICERKVCIKDTYCVKTIKGKCKKAKNVTKSCREVSYDNGIPSETCTCDVFNVEKYDYVMGDVCENGMVCLKVAAVDNASIPIVDYQCGVKLEE